MSACAQPQWVDGREYWPEHWGLRRSQIQELLTKLRQDDHWKRSNTVYTLVQDFVIPWTRGTGRGYALTLNSASPLEVNLMISHSWAENAEDFLEALLRSTRADDVLFVCALSLYQAADEHGPSIADQIGSSAPESPFRRVLEHIRRKGGDGGMLWRWRTVVSWVPSACLLLAACLYLLPLLLWTCVPGFRQCAHVIKFREDWVWGDYPHPWARLAPALAMLCATLAVLTFAALWWMQPYAGRMVVVPNREGDIYTRLWCTYEVFTAMRLGVHVKVANTLATAGCGRSEEARCSCEEDARRIRGEIADEGHTFPEIDRAVRLLFWRRFWSVTRTCVVSTFVLTVCMSVEVTGIVGTCDGNRGSIVMAIMSASAFVVTVVYLITSWNQGVVSVRLAFTTSVGLILVSGVGAVNLVHDFVGNDCGQLGLEVIWACEVLQLAGVSLLVMSVSARAPVRCHPLIQVSLVAVAIWILNDRLLEAWWRCLWHWRRGLSMSFGIDFWVPLACKWCRWRDCPYPCSVWLGAELGKSIIPACLLVAQAAAWGVRPRRVSCCVGDRPAADDV
uniref:Transmembrane protein n=1 Tax=Zooxanthella nutricula TaxID=1333877 RepID=A0A7S2JK05_9DINO